MELGSIPGLANTVKRALVAQCCNLSCEKLLFEQMEHALLVWFIQTTRKANATMWGICAQILPLSHYTKMPGKQSQKSCLVARTVMGSIPNKCWAFFLFLSRSRVYLIRSPEEVKHY